MRSFSTRINAMPRPPVDADRVAGLTIPVKVIYESDRFIVTTSDDERNPCFEVVDKAPAKVVEAFLHGASADYLFSVIKSWQLVTPDQDQVEATLDMLIWCNAHVLVVH